MKDPTPDQNEQTGLNLPNESSDSPYPPPSLNDTCADHILKKLSRRNMLRNSAITATGVALLPSFLTGCNKDVWEKVKEQIPGGGLGGVPEPPPTTEELQAAAQALLDMEAWLADLYDGYTSKYENTVYHWVKSGDKPSGWQNFVVDVFTIIGVGIFDAALAAAEVEFPFAGPAIAIAGATVNKWALGQDAPNFESAYVEFVDGHSKIHLAISDMLIDMAGRGDNYSMLRNNWNKVLKFHDKEYRYKDLAKSEFPTKADGSHYTKIREAAYHKFREHVWNVMFVKCAKMYYVYEWVKLYPILLYKNAKESHYPDYPQSYLRARWYPNSREFGLTYFYFLIDGSYISADAAHELFKDDYPGNNDYNPNGLFSRDYVFKQFHREKPDFEGYLDIRKNDDLSVPEDQLDLNSDNYVFTQGDFSKLAKLVPL
jgi:hypothetical protein